MLNWTHIEITPDNADEVISTWVEDLKSGQVEVAGFDTEGSGLHIIKDRPFLFQCGYNKGRLGYTFIIQLDIYQDLGIRIISVWNNLIRQAPIYAAHNVKFDLHMLTNIEVPYTGKNITDSMFWIRLASNAVPTRKGGVNLKLKAFAKKYISSSAADMNKLLDKEKTEITKGYNMLLRKRLKWSAKKLKDFFDDKLHDVNDLPVECRVEYEEWKFYDLPAYMRDVVTGYVDKDQIRYNVLNRKNINYYGHLDVVWVIETILMCKPIVEVRNNMRAIEYENSNIYPLLEMERVGYKIDTKYLLDCKIKMKEYILNRREDLQLIAGIPDLKCGQNAVILKALQDMGAEITTTNADDLYEYVADREIEHGRDNIIELIEILQELRRLEKWYSTYLMRFINDIDTGMIYTSIHQVGAASGRVSSDFQQFPKEGILSITGEELFQPRRLILTKNSEEYWGTIYLDYSQIELRFQALYTILVKDADFNLCRAYMPYECISATGESFDCKNYKHIKRAYSEPWYLKEDNTTIWVPLDVHGATTKIAFSIDETAENYHELRYLGKRANFAKNYGAKRPQIRRMFPSLTEEAITKIDEAYYIAFPGVKSYHNYCYKIATVSASVGNLFNVNYYGVSGHNLINMLIQGSAAYFLKWKIAEVHKYLKSVNAKSKIVMQIHDEIQIMAHRDDDIEIFFKIKEIMENWEDAYVPIIADMEVSTTTWAEKFEITTRKELQDAKNKSTNSTNGT